MTSIETVCADITTISVDAIVNAANARLGGGGGVDGAIHQAAGPIIAVQCRRWVAENGKLPTGEVMATDAGDLPCRYVIHTVGPIWGEHNPADARRLLAACYVNSLDLAVSRDWKSVAFPNISTGIYGYPKRDAAEVAIEAVTAWCDSHEGVEKILFVCFDAENAQIYSELLGG